MSDFIPLSVPAIRGNEWQYIKECLDTEWVSSAGKYVDRFEQDIARFTGAKHAVACVNGTSALHIALQLVGVKPGDEVIVPTVTFVAPVNVVRYCFAEPVFMDCDDYYNIDVEKLEQFLKRQTHQQGGVCINKKSGKSIRAIIPVHVFGNAARLDALLPLCSERNIRVVEDASESLGTRYVGCCGDRHTGTVAEVGCLSFNGNKIITTGGGGMILTDQDELAARARYLTTQAKTDEVRYTHGDVGYNYRLTNIQAALGVAQLEQLPEYLQIKRKNFTAYREALQNVAGLRIAPGPGYAENNYWMYALQIDPRKYGRDREGVMAHLAAQRIQSRPLWYLNHLQKPYAGCEAWDVALAPQLLASTLNLPCSVNLKEEQIQRVLAALGN